MLGDLKNELLTREAVIEHESILVEAASEAEEDNIMGEIASVDAELSPEDRKQCEDVLKTIPEYEEPKEEITKDDVKAAKNVHEPTIEELAENMVIF